MPPSATTYPLSRIWLLIRLVLHSGVVLGGLYVWVINRAALSADRTFEVAALITLLLPISSLMLVYSLYHLRQGAIVLSDTGLQRRHQHLAWATIDGLHLSWSEPRNRRAPSRQHHARLHLTRQGRTLLIIGDRFRDYRALIDAIAAHVSQHHFPILRETLAAGGTVSAGQLQLERHRLTIAGRPLRHDQVMRVAFEPLKVVIHASIGRFEAPLTQRGSLLVALYIANAWATSAYPRRLEDQPVQYPVTCMPTGHIRLQLEAERVTLIDAEQRSHVYPLAAVAYRLNGRGSVWLLLEGQPRLILNPYPHWLEALKVTLAQRLQPTHRQQLAAGEAVTFGAVRLWADKVAVQDEVIERRLIHTWRAAPDGLRWLDVGGAVRLTIHPDDLPNPDLFAELIADWRPALAPSAAFGG